MSRCSFSTCKTSALAITHTYTPWPSRWKEPERRESPLSWWTAPTPSTASVYKETCWTRRSRPSSGWYPTPMRHGMTPGELARLFHGEFGVEVELHVVPMSGWARSDSFDDTELPWVPPSPNMPSVESARHYPGTCLFEGTNFSVGRGTPVAFQQIGAPWIDGEVLATRLNEYGIVGARFEPVRFTPENPGDGKHGGVEVGGVRVSATSPDYDPTEAAVAALIEARALSGENWAWRDAAFDRLAGTDRLRTAIEAGAPLEEAREGWSQDLSEFLAVRQLYLLY